MTSRHFQEGQCSWLVQGYVEDNSSFSKGDFLFFPCILLGFFYTNKYVWLHLENVSLPSVFGND